MDYNLKGTIILSLQTLIESMLRIGLFVECRECENGTFIEVVIQNINNNEKTSYMSRYSEMLEMYNKQRHRSEFNKGFERQIIKNRCKRLAIDEYIKTKEITLIV